MNIHFFKRNGGIHSKVFGQQCHVYFFFAKKTKIFPNSLTNSIPIGKADLDLCKFGQIEMGNIGRKTFGKINENWMKIFWGNYLNNAEMAKGNKYRIEN